MAVGAALEELRVQELDRPQFFLDDVVDRDRDVRGERVGALSSEKRKTGIFVRYGVSGQKNGTVTM